MLKLSTKDNTNAKLCSQQPKKVNITRLGSVNKVQNWEPDTTINEIQQRLKFKNVAGNTEHKLLVKSKMEISSNLVAFSKNINLLILGCNGCSDRAKATELQ